MKYVDLAKKVTLEVKLGEFLASKGKIVFLNLALYLHTV
jgi:hypothetical protein